MSVFIGSTTTAQRNCLSKEFKKLYAKKNFIPRKQKIAIALNTCNVGIKGMKKEEKNERYVVMKNVRFGMLFGYYIWDNEKQRETAYEYGEDDLDKAITRASILNQLSKIK
jgi:hypothetical protein